MATTSQPQFEEKRFALRMALRLPIVVSGRTDDGAAWSEPTETEDISTLGALFHLNQKGRSRRKSVFAFAPTGRRSRRSQSQSRQKFAGQSRHFPRRRLDHRIKENWLRLFVAWIADDNVEELEDED